MLTYGGDAASTGAVAAAKQSGARAVFWLHNVEYRSPGCFAACDAIVVPSRSHQDHYRRTLGLTTTIIPGPWDIERVRCDARNPRFATFVNPERAKGACWFARVAEQLHLQNSGVEFLVVEGRGRVNAIASGGIDLSDVTSIHQMKNTPDPRAFYEVTKVLLMPSLVSEGLPRTAVEAMLNGIPVIGSGRGGLSEVLSLAGDRLDIPEKYLPDTRIPPEPSEVTAWVDRLSQLWTDPAEYERASAAALAASTVWHPDRLFPRWEEFLTRIAAGNR